MVLQAITGPTAELPPRPYSREQADRHEIVYHFLQTRFSDIRASVAASWSSCDSPQLGDCWRRHIGRDTGSRFVALRTGRDGRPV